MNLVWLDLEMSGLDIQSNKIIEIAVVVTNSKLDILAQGPSLVVFQPESHMAAMDEWCTKHHAETGLTAEVLESCITERDAEQQVIEFISKWVKKGESPMCGNSIGTDRSFINKYMPELHSWFHYRNFDVSTLKMANKFWNQAGLEYQKDDSQQHRAMHDTLESIAEAKFYMVKQYAAR